MALIVAALWAWLSVTPPAPLSLGAPPELFSAARAQIDIKAIAQAPHPVGSAESARVRAYLAQRLRTLGATVSEQAVPLPPKSVERLAKWRGTVAGAIGHNVIGLLPGSDRRQPALLLMAHHDSVWGSPGAADDAMGVASALEILRAIRAKGTPLRDVILLFSDAEEIGLDGANAFFEHDPLAAHVGVVVNLEARGGSGRANMFETGPDNGAMMRLYADRVRRPASNSAAILIYDHMPNSTDYTVPKQRGIAGFNIANLGGASLYHSPLSTPDAIDPATLQDMGVQALDLANALAFAPSLPPRRPSMAFSDVLGRMTIAYPTPLGWVPVLLSAILIGLALWRRPVPARQVGAAVVTVVALLLHGALLLTVLNAVSAGWPINYYDRLAALPRLETIALFGIVALLALAPLLHARERRMAALVPALLLLGPGLLLGVALPVIAILSLATMAVAWFLPRTAPDARSGSIAATLLLFGFATGVQLLLPTAAPLFAWSLLLASIALAARSLLAPIAGLMVTAGAAAIGIGHLAGFAHFTFLAVGAGLPLAMIAYLFAGLPLLWPLLPDRPAILVAAGALLLALGIALWVRWDPMAPGIPVYSLAEGGGKTRE